MREDVKKFISSVSRPGRYTGGERGCVLKDRDAVDLRVAFCFPDSYEIGMSNLGMRILCAVLNDMDRVLCERVYAPWPDMEEKMREAGVPLFTLDSGDAVGDFDIVAFTMQYELCYTNILQVLDLAGIPLLSKERGENCPIVMGGGPCTYNPEPIADFFDLFYIGESETVMDTLMDVYKECKTNGVSREEFLHRAAKIEGIYVPSLLCVSYNEDGTIKAFEPKYEDLPDKVRKQTCMDFTNAPYPKKPLVPYLRPTQDRVTLEIMRGCIRGCRFCQAGILYRPLREKDIETLKSQADIMMKYSGHEEISLSSLSSSDYSRLPELMDYLIEKFHSQAVNISLPSLRIDNFSLDVMQKVQDIKKSSLTFAPEAGTQRLRNVINKGLTEDDIFGGSAMAFRGGWNKVKLYFMLGLPTETEDDRKGIAHLAQSICDVYYDIPKEERRGKCDINVSTSFFVPKPFTPFQWAPMFRREDYLTFAHLVKGEIRSMKNQKSIHYQYHDADGTVLEGVLARGDRKLSRVILYAYEHGAIYDAWTDYFHMDIWMDAFAACGIDHEFYTLRNRPLDEVLPWDFIDVGVTKKWFVRECERALRAEITPNCRQMCSGCGERSYGGGVCFEEKSMDAGKADYSGMR